MAEEKKQDIVKEIEKEESKALKELRKNPWIISTFVFVILTLILLFVAFRGGNGKSVSESAIGAQAVDFINSQILQGQGNVTLASVGTEAGLYKVTVNYNGQQIPTYFTKDGAYYVGTMIAPTNPSALPAGNSTAPTTPPKDIPKSAKPVVNAYVFAYCPYGLQFEKALFPVYDLLKSNADINIVYIGAMHGEFEHVESLRQISILNLYGKDKLISYLKLFDTSTDIGACSGDATCLNKYLPAIYTQLGIDATKVNAYMNASAENIYQQDEAQASAAGVTGSPTFMINGVEASVSRTPAAIETAVCSAFSTAPSACSQTLSSTSTSAGFGGAAAAAGSTTGATC